MLTFASIVNGAFRHFRERPLAVLIWGVVYTVATFGYTLVMQPMMMSRLSEAQPGSLEASTAALGMMLPLYLIMFVIGTIIIAASLRTLLRPGEERVAGLRFGMDELRLLALFLMFAVALIILWMVGGIAAVALGALLSLLVGGSGFLAFLPSLALFCLLVFLLVRLSLVSTLTIYRRKIVIGESWSLTKGHFWRLFGAYFVLFVMLFVLYVIIMVLTVGPIFGPIFSQGFSAQSMQAMSQMQSQLGGVTVMTVISGIAGGLLAGASYAVWAGAAATATQDLIGRTDDDLAETFA